MGQINTNTQMPSLSLGNINDHSDLRLKSDGSIGKHGFKSRALAFLKGLAGQKADSSPQGIQQQNQRIINNLSQQLQAKGLSATQAGMLIGSSLTEETCDGGRSLQGRDISNVRQALASVENITNSINSEVGRLGQSPQAADLTDSHAVLSGLLHQAKDISTLSEAGQTMLAHNLATTLAGGSPATLENVNSALQDLKSPVFRTALNDILSGLPKFANMNIHEKKAALQGIETIMQTTVNKLEMQRTALGGEGRSPMPAPVSTERKTQIDSSFKAFASTANLEISSLDQVKRDFVANFSNQRNMNTFLRETGPGMEFNNHLKGLTTTTLVPFTAALNTGATQYVDAIKTAMITADPARFPDRESIRVGDMNGFIKGETNPIRRGEPNPSYNPNREPAQNLGLRIFKELVNNNPALKQQMQTSYRQAFETFAGDITRENNMHITDSELEKAKQILASSLFLSSTSDISRNGEDNAKAFATILNGLITGENSTELIDFILGRDVTA